MNVLVSTTRDWNLGDEIIWIGVKKLLDEVIGDVNYFFYNRNPDLFPYRILHGNYVTHVPEYIDLVVLAGTPEFYDVKMDGFYNSVGDRTVWAIGIAWGVEHLIPNENELSFIERENYRIIARSEITRNIITKPIEVLPCPALLCSDKMGKKKKSCYVGNVEYDKTGELEVITYHLKDFEKAPHSRYITEPEDLIKAVGEYEQVYTDRLHAGFAAMATGSSVTFTKSDFRIDSAVETANQYAGNLKSDYLKILNSWKQKL